MPRTAVEAGRAEWRFGGETPRAGGWRRTRGGVVGDRAPEGLRPRGHPSGRPGAVRRDPGDHRSRRARERAERGRRGSGPGGEVAVVDRVRTGDAPRRRCARVVRDAGPEEARGGLGKGVFTDRALRWRAAQPGSARRHAPRTRREPHRSASLSGRADGYEVTVFDRDLGVATAGGCRIDVDRIDVDCTDVGRSTSTGSPCTRCRWGRSARICARDGVFAGAGHREGGAPHMLFTDAGPVAAGLAGVRMVRIPSVSGTWPQARPTARRATQGFPAVRPRGGLSRSEQRRLGPRSGRAVAQGARRCTSASSTGSATPGC